jgi:hypothetical protein
MSALHQKADITERGEHVRFVPKAGVRRRALMHALGQGGEQTEKRAVQSPAEGTRR